MKSIGTFFKKSLLLGISIAAGILLPLNNSSAQNSNDAYEIKSFDVSGRVSLEVLTSGGSIEVEGTSDNVVRVEMYVRKNGRYLNEGEADLDQYEIEIFQRGDQVTAEAKRKSGNNWNWNRNNYSISFVVFTPAETRTRLKTSGGSISVMNLMGTQELKTSGGSLHAESIVGEMVLKTSGGSINIFEAEGNVEAKTSGGRIEAGNITGNLDLKTSGGSIDIENVAGNVEAKTSGGSIRASVTNPKDFIDLKTSGGSIRINVPGNLGYDVDLDGSRVRADLKNFSGESERDELRGTLNGGGTRIKAKTSGGSVNLNYL